MDVTKYDRQIRLFGFKTQEKILHRSVQVLGTPSSISSEIIKNIVLIGTGKIIISKELLVKTKDLVPDDLTRINEKLEVITQDTPTECDFMFLIDYASIEFDSDGSTRGTIVFNSGDDTFSPLYKSSIPFYFICSKCLIITKNNTNHDCTNRCSQDEEEEGAIVPRGLVSLAVDCIVGAFAVQEYLKFIVDPENSVDSYRFNL
ncbi:hypothetical protein PAEPH01_1766 [Pancytospora epiphaga]|nr:hypothetical protein PAEPH01_1766 [Pancytospora epiphaga]